MNLRDIEIFCAIAETGNLSQAARRLSVTAMTVSRCLARLEKALGVRLFQRTTRAVALTQEGEEFLPYARAMTDAELTAKNMFSADAQGAYGLLRITAPSGFGRRTILPLLPGLIAENPKLQTELDLSDDEVDIVGQGYDVAIRIAPLKDSQLIAHKLADNPRILCASPDYLRQYGQPHTLADLHAHQCLKITTVPYWRFVKEGRLLNQTVEARFSCSNVEGVRSMCLAGAGIAQLTTLDVDEELSTGALVALTLQDADPQALAVWALLPTRRFVPRRTTVFLAALKASLQQNPRRGV